MADKPRKLPPLGFAGFEDSSAAGGRRRKATWPLRPMHEPSEGATADASRFLTKPKPYASPRRKPK